LVRTYAQVRWRHVLVCHVNQRPEQIWSPEDGNETDQGDDCSGVSDDNIGGGEDGDGEDSDGETEPADAIVNKFRQGKKPASHKPASHKPAIGKGKKELPDILTGAVYNDVLATVYEWLGSLEDPWTIKVPEGDDEDEDDDDDDDDGDQAPNLAQVLNRVVDEICEERGIDRPEDLKIGKGTSAFNHVRPLYMRNCLLCH
jgi:hypothetical protein